MLKQIVFCIFFGITFPCFSQDKEVNFIISIDGNLTQIYGGNITMKNAEGDEETMQVKYVPGKLSIEKHEFDRIMSKSVGDLNLNIRYHRAVKDNVSYLSYKIEDFKKSWLIKGNFFILYVYTSENKNNRKKYKFLPGQEITYEYDWSEGSMRRTTKN